MALLRDTDNANSTESMRLPATAPWRTCPGSALLVTVERSSREYFLLHLQEEKKKFFGQHLSNSNGNG